MDAKSKSKSVATCLRIEGNKYFKDGQYDKAVYHYNEAIKHDKNNPTLYSNLAQAHLAQRRFAEAEKQASIAILLDADLLKSYYRAAKAAENLGAVERAIKYLNDGMNRPRIDIDDYDKFLERYCQLVGFEVPTDIDPKLFEQPTTKKAKKKLKMTRTEAGDQFLRTLERLRSENPTEFNRAQLAIKRKRVNLNVALRDASANLLNKNPQPHTAGILYKTALDIIADVHPEELLELSVMDKVVLKYALSVSWSHKSATYQEVAKAVEYLNEIRHTVDAAVFPAVLYPLAMIYISINRFPQALELLEEGLNIIASGNLFSTFNWPQTDVLINETTAEGLQTALNNLKPDCQGYHKPDAVCKHFEENCEKLSQQIVPSRFIFFSDLDFIGFMEVHCQSKCLIEYHLACWKDFKETYSISNSISKLSDRDMLGKPCPTDGCSTLSGDPSVIVQIQLMYRNREVKFHCEREPAPVAKEPKQAKKKDTIKPPATDKEKPKTRPRAKLPPPESANTKRPGGKLRFGTMDHGDLDGSGDEGGLHDRERIMEEYKALRAKNFNYTADKCWHLSRPFYGRTDLPPDRWLLNKDATTTKEFIASFFFELLSSREPMSIEELLDSWELAIDDYPEFREITMKPGFPGIVKYLLESYRFVMINDFITIADKVTELESVQLDETIECLTFFLAEAASLAVNYSPETGGSNNGAGDSVHVGEGFQAAREFFGHESIGQISPTRAGTSSTTSSEMKIKPSSVPASPVKVKPERSNPVIKPSNDSSKISTDLLNFNQPKNEFIKDNHTVDSFEKSEEDMKEYLAKQASLGIKDGKKLIFDDAKKIEKGVKMQKVTEDTKVVKVAEEKIEIKFSEEKKMAKPKEEKKTEDKKIKPALDVKVTGTPTVKKKATIAVQSTINDKVPTSLEDKEVQTEAAIDNTSEMEIRMEGIVEENKLMQKRVENADEITMVLLDSRKKTQAQLEALVQEKQEVVRERDALVKERDNVMRKAASEVEAFKAHLEACQKKEVEKNAAYDKMKRDFFVTQRELVLIRRDLGHLTFEETMKQLSIAMTYPQLPPPKQDYLSKMRDQLAKLQRATNDSNSETVALYDHVADRLDEVDNVSDLPKVAIAEIPAHMLAALMEVQQRYTPAQQPPQEQLPQNIAPFPAQQQNNFYHRPNPGMPHPHQVPQPPHQLPQQPQVMIQNHVMMPPQHSFGIRSQYPMMSPQMNLAMSGQQGFVNYQQQYPQQVASHGLQVASQSQSSQLMGPPVSYAKPVNGKNPNIINEIFSQRNGVSQPGRASPASVVEPQRTHSNSSAESNASTHSVGRDAKVNGHVQQMRSKLNLVPSDRPNTSYDRLIAVLMEKFPQSSHDDVMDCVTEICNKNNGTLKGFSVDTVVSLTESILKRKTSKKSAWAPVDKVLEVNWTNKNKDDCVICMEPISPTQLVELHCKHQFHDLCIRKWLEVESVCPTCMRYTKMVSDYPPLK